MILLTIILFLFFAIHDTVHADDHVKRVLHIDSYHTGYVWSDAIARAIREEFLISGINAEITTEHLDSRRFADKAHFKFFAQTLQKKFEGYTFDVVIVSDNAAFDLAVKHRNDIFKDIPIVFCGYNFFKPELIKNITNITGINEEVDVLDNVKMALKVHPKTKVLVFVISTGDLTNRIHANIYETSVLPVLSRQYEVLTLKDKSVEEIRDALNEIPKESLVFLFGQTSQETLGRHYLPEENGRIISSISPVPVYTFWDIHMNTGVIGGNIIRGEDQGRKVAELAIRILKGEKADNIPVIMKTPVSTVFDYKVLKRFGISTKALPKGSIVINSPQSIWDLYRSYIIFGIVVFCIVLILIILLLANIRQRKRAMQLLEKERQLLDTKVEERTLEFKKANESLQILWLAIEQTPISVVITDKDGNIEYVNSAFCEITGYSKVEAIGQNPRILKSNIHSERFYKNMWETLIAKRVWIGEICNKKKDGSLFWESATISPIVLDGNISKYLAIKKDITDNKNAENLREDVERIMRHDLKGPLNAIINIPELLWEAENLTDEQRKDLMLIKQSGEMMLEQINMSLNIYKMETKAYKLNPLPVNINNLLSKVLEMLKMIAQKKGINVKIISSIDSPTLLDLKVSGEEALCVSIFQNIIKNAIEASPKEKEIIININKTDSSALISITNEGTVDAKIKPFFFEKYTTSGKSGGTGLGTYSAKLMTEVQGGKISLHTDDKPNVTVTVELPLA